MEAHSPGGTAAAMGPASEELGQGELFEWVLRAWNGARAGLPTLVLVVGEAGIGKSRLLRKLGARLGGSSALVAAPPLLSGLLRSCGRLLSEEHDPAFLAAARHLQPAGPWSNAVIEMSVPSSREELNLALAHALSRMAWRRPGACLLLDDVHDWSSDDQGALRVLFLRAVAARAPLTVVMAGRPSLDEEWWGTLVQESQAAGAAAALRSELKPLDERANRELVEEVLRTARLPGSLPQWLFARAGGHPLHTVELLRFLMDGGALENVGPAWRFRAPRAAVLPEGLEAVLDARLQKMREDPELWRALAALAIIERPCELREWGPLAGLSEELLIELGGEEARLGLVRLELGGGMERYSLSHPLYPNRMRALLPRSERRALHRQAAESARRPGERARHARLGGHPRADEWTWQAVHAARESLAFDELIGHADALLPRAGARRSRLLYLLGEARYYLGELERASDTLADSREPEAPVLRTVALRRLGRLEQALALVQGCLAVQPGTVHLEVLQVSLLLQLNREEGRSSLAELLARAPAGSLSWALLKLERGRELHGQGRFREALEASEEAVEPLRAAGDAGELARALNNVGIFASQLGLWDRSERALLESIELADARGDRAYLGSRRLNLGSLYLRRGDYARAGDAYEAALRLAELNGDGEVTAHARLSLAELALLHGDPGKARELYRHALASLQEAGLAGSLPLCRAALLHAEAHCGQPEPVAEELRRIAASVRHPNLALLHGEVLLLSGAAAAAAELFETQDLAQLRPTLAAQYRLGLALARTWLGELEGADEELSAAAELLAGEPEHPLQGLLAMQRAVLADQRGRTSAVPQLAAQGRERLAASGAWGHLLTLERLYPQVRAWREAGPATGSGMGPGVEPGVFLRALGRFELESGGSAVAWKARKVRELLALLLVATLRESGPWLPREQVIASLWPESAGERAEASFRATLKRLRSALGDAGRIERRRDGGLRMLLLRCDVTLFLDALEAGQDELALAWYGGDLLPGSEAPGVEPLRERLRAYFREAAGRVAASLPPARAAELYQRLLEDDPFDVASHCGLVLSLRASDRLRARRTLEAAARRFREELGDLPPELTQLLAEGEPLHLSR